jgi:hypothetical protein
MNEETKKKKFLMKIGIASLMFLILFFWILNVKNVFKTNPSNEVTQSQAEWQNIKKDFGNTVDQVNTSLDKITATNEKLKTASSSLLNELINETNKIASSNEELATSSSSAIPVHFIPDLKNTNCPEYINCMPSIGEAQSCQIPAGCEGITEIAY